MFIEIDKISPKGLVLEDKVNMEESVLIEEESFFLKDIDFKMLLSRDGRKVKSKGEIDTAVSLRCVNCLDPFELPIRSNFDIILFPVDLIDPSSTALSSDEMEYIFFDGNKVDVKKILMEQVNLFVPYRPVCSPHCKGLCSYCGANLNHENCQCKNSTKEISFLFNKVKR